MVRCVEGLGDCDLVLKELRSRVLISVYVIASTKTSTIPGISVAGASPEATLYTPALDVEYLYLGMPVGMNIIPVTPEGLPTPAVITRSCIELGRMPAVIVDAGSAMQPKIPRVTLPSKTVGKRIDVASALPPGTARELYSEAKLLGRKLAAGGAHAFILGESMPGGTTTAMAILAGLGYDALGKTSSSSPNNPVELKVKVVEKALYRLKHKVKCDPSNPFGVIDCVGDPLHVVLAGFAAGAITEGSMVLLAGGTQMAAVLAIMKAVDPEALESGRVAVGTTRWIVEDKSSDLEGLVREVSPSIPVMYTELSFSDSPYSGLRMYEEGYVKEGVGAGGTSIAVEAKGFKLSEIKEAIYREYERLISLGAAKA